MLALIIQYVKLLYCDGVEVGLTSGSLWVWDYGLPCTCEGVLAPKRTRFRVED